MTHDPRRLREALILQMSVDDAGDAALLDALVDALPRGRAPARARARLLAAAAADPWGPFVAPLARLFEVAADAARDMLGRIDMSVGWEPLLPNAQAMHFTGGPSTAGADVGFVRVEDGTDFPAHEHLGAERNLVLRGTLVEADGTRHGPGDVFERGPGPLHAFRAEGDLIFAVVVFGVRFPGMPEPD